MTRPRTRALRPVCAALAAAASVVLAAGCGSDTSASGSTDAGTTAAPETVSFILDWFPNADHAGVYRAVDSGAFRAKGLTVTPTVPTDPAASIKQVAAGKADFALTYEPEVLIARSEGIPVKAVGALVTTPLNTVMARADRGITRPRDLEGKTVGIAGVPSDRPLLDAVVRNDGGDPAKVKVKTIGFTLAPALAAGKVDATIGSYWNVEAVELRKKGVPLSVFRLERNGVPTYDELVVIASDKTVAERPDTVRRFLAALAEGQTGAVADQKAAVASLVKANPDLDAAVTAEQLALTAPALAPAGGNPLAMSPDDWKAFAAFMTANKLVSKPVDAAQAMTTELLPGGEG